MFSGGGDYVPEGEIPILFQDRMSDGQGGTVSCVRRILVSGDSHNRVVVARQVEAMCPKGVWWTLSAAPTETAVSSYGFSDKAHPVLGWWVVLLGGPPGGDGSFEFLGMTAHPGRNRRAAKFGEGRD